MGGKTKKLALSALLITADVILTRLLAINTNVMKIGLGFTAVALCALLYGPWWLYPDGGLYGADLRAAAEEGGPLPAPGAGGGAEHAAGVVSGQYLDDLPHHRQPHEGDAGGPGGAVGGVAAAAESGAAVADPFRLYPRYPGGRKSIKKRLF